MTAATLVSLAVTPVNPSVPKGTSVQLTATGTFSDGSKEDLTNQAFWSSAFHQFVTVTQTGLATAIGPAGQFSNIQALVETSPGMVVTGLTKVTITP